MNPQEHSELEKFLDKSDQVHVDLGPLACSNELNVRSTSRARPERWHSKALVEIPRSVVAKSRNVLSAAAANQSDSPDTEPSPLAFPQMLAIIREDASRLSHILCCMNC